MPSTSSPQRRRHKRKLPAIVIPESTQDDNSSDNGHVDVKYTNTEPNAQKRVRFKKSSSSSQSGTECDIELRHGNKPRFISCSYDSSETDSADQIPNAQSCKYPTERNNTTDEDNDEETPEPPPSQTQSSLDRTQQRSQCELNNQRPEPSQNIKLDPTPPQPEGISQFGIVDCPTTSTPKESVDGTYSLISKQHSLSTL